MVRREKPNMNEKSLSFSQDDCLKPEKGSEHMQPKFETSFKG
jgi:hypothetical protein